MKKISLNWKSIIFVLTLFSTVSTYISIIVYVTRKCLFERQVMSCDLLLYKIYRYPRMPPSLIIKYLKMRLNLLKILYIFLSEIPVLELDLPSRFLSFWVFKHPNQTRMSPKYKITFHNRNLVLDFTLAPTSPILFLFI